MPDRDIFHRLARPQWLPQLARHFSVALGHAIDPSRKPERRRRHVKEVIVGQRADRQELLRDRSPARSQIGPAQAWTSSRPNRS